MTICQIIEPNTSVVDESIDETQKSYQVVLCLSSLFLWVTTGQCLGGEEYEKRFLYEIVKKIYGTQLKDG